jgi:lipid IVA palmitoyltransferase
MQLRNYLQLSVIKFNLLKKLHVISIVIYALSPVVACAEEPENCSKWPAWFKPVCNTLDNTWNKGRPELYLTGYAWHNRYTYSEKRLKTYNEAAWGGGLGKGFIDKDGDWNALYMMAFLDSHKNVEPLGGYAFIKTADFSKHVHGGLGYTVFITARPDIFKGRPFPGILPLASFSILRLSVFATYIPGAAGAGNVLFCFAKFRF